MTVKYLFIGWNTKQFRVPFSSKWLLPIKQLESKVFNLFNSFLTSTFSVLFSVIFLLILDNLASKSAFVIKLPCANLALKISAAKVLNCGVVIYLSRLWLLTLFSISVIFVLWSVFLAKLITLGILISTVVNAVFVAKLLASGILLAISVILVF